MKRFLLLGAVLLVLVGGVAFYRFGLPGGDGKNPVDTATSSFSGGPPPGTIYIEDKGFQPEKLVVSDGNREVTWVNRDSVTYYMTVIDEGDVVFSRTIPANSNFSWYFSQEGEYSFSTGETDQKGRVTVK